MNCRACNTYIEDGDRNCANCGRTVNPGLSGGVLGRRSGGAVPLSPSQVVEPVELGAAERVEGAAGSSGARRRAAASAPAAAAPGAQRLRGMLASEPDLLEPGLRIYAARDGRQIGVSYPTDVGEIDLLGVDDSGALVVVLIDEGAKGGELVPEILHRMGWVRKHLGQDQQEVRGLVLMQSAPEDLGYAAAAVRDSVTFKTWRMSLVLEDVEL